MSRSLTISIISSTIFPGISKTSFSSGVGLFSEDLSGIPLFQSITLSFSGKIMDITPFTFGMNSLTPRHLREL
jgi:hypothetical protein